MSIHLQDTAEIWQTTSATAVLTDLILSRSRQWQNICLDMYSAPLCDSILSAPNMHWEQLRVLSLSSDAHTPRILISPSFMIFAPQLRSLSLDRVAVDLESMLCLPLEQITHLSLEIDFSMWEYAIMLQHCINLVDCTIRIDQSTTRDHDLVPAILRLPKLASLCLSDASLLRHLELPGISSIAFNSYVGGWCLNLDADELISFLSRSKCKLDRFTLHHIRFTGDEGNSDLLRCLSEMPFLRELKIHDSEEESLDDFVLLSLAEWCHLERPLLHHLEVFDMVTDPHAFTNAALADMVEARTWIGDVVDHTGKRSLKSLNVGYNLLEEGLPRERLLACRTQGLALKLCLP